MEVPRVSLLRPGIPRTWPCMPLSSARRTSSAPVDPRRSAPANETANDERPEKPEIPGELPLSPYLLESIRPAKAAIILAGPLRKTLWQIRAQARHEQRQPRMIEDRAKQPYSSLIWPTSRCDPHRLQCPARKASSSVRPALARLSSFVTGNETPSDAESKPTSLRKYSLPYRWKTSLSSRPRSIEPRCA